MHTVWPKLHKVVGVTSDMDVTPDVESNTALKIFGGTKSPGRLLVYTFIGIYC